MEIDVMGVAETFINDDVMHAEISIEGHTMYRKDRCIFKEGKAGGVLLYILGMKLFLTTFKILIEANLNQSGVKLR